MLTGITHGKAGVRRLAQRSVLWRVNVIWYLVAILLVSVSEMLVAAALGCPGALRAMTPAAWVFYPVAYFTHSSLVHAQREQAEYSPRAWDSSGRFGHLLRYEGGRLDRRCYDGGEGWRLFALA
jgi:hypothetical protein